MEEERKGLEEKGRIKRGGGGKKGEEKMVNKGK